MEKNSLPHNESQKVDEIAGGLAPLMPAVDWKKKTPSDKKVTWQWRPFKHSARKDDLQLSHWVKVVNGVPPTGDYSFAKYNKSVDITSYTDEEYEKYLTNPNWTKEETDQLFDLCDRFNLKFIVIADRFPSSRTVEELKDRYYSVSQAILIARNPSSGDDTLDPLVKEPYNISQEMKRKRALSLILSQTKQQERRDEEVLAEAKRISELRIKVAGESKSVAASNSSVDVTERASPNETVSPSNMQRPSTVLPSIITSDNLGTSARGLH
ncbi:SWR1-complex protein 4-like [Vicia villosa]|uniref:SWR1-complex protein 4-like n=1 Tax=Vicia villosa TaxID=3911 RepID=UPI00273C154B|nr:SWR1-complex protein 4-like [Vicia villosa]